MLKTCPTCHLIKPEEEFSRQAKSKDGRYPYCKACTKVRTRAAYAARGKRSWMNDKVCTWCGVLKSRTEYERTAQGKVHPRCKKCELEVAVFTARGRRRCSTCKKWKNTADYHPSKLAGKHVTCIECIKTYQAARVYERRTYELRKNYGITMEQYVQLLKLQNYTCPICSEKFEQDNYSYSVDHAHGGKHRGKIRGITHRDCNRHVLWSHDDSRQLRNAADLIDNPLTNWLVPENMINAFEKDPK